jgi:hypothetical protein
MFERRCEVAHPDVDEEVSQGAHIETFIHESIDIRRSVSLMLGIGREGR